MAHIVHLGINIELKQSHLMNKKAKQQQQNE